MMAADRVPSFVASEASIVAIFAGRITEGAGRPARDKAVIPTSSGQPRFAALVIMTTHRRPCVSSKLGNDTTRAGRDCRVERSV
jgi:hypothetical protein